MPKSYSTKRTRDEALFAHWDSRDETVFSGLGLTKDGVKAVQSRLIGKIVMPGDPTYDTDRMLANPIFNPMPSCIVFCETEADVAEALIMSKGANMPFAVRSGGHCTAGYSGGAGITIDMRNINHVHVDKFACQAEVGAGCDFARFNQALEHWGMHTPGGECDGVCIGGYVQGGGIGFTSATFGMNCDNVLSMRVMLADGSIVTCSDGLNTDLWWAMRGGTGGNFGVLLSVKYRIYPMDKVLGWALAWRMDVDGGIDNCVRAAQVLQEVYMSGEVFDQKLTTQLLLVYQSEIVPGEPLGKNVPVFMIRGLYHGDQNEGIASMDRLKELTGCIEQFTVWDTYTEVLSQLLDKPQEQPVFPAELGEDPFEDKASRYIERDLTADEWRSILSLFVDESPNEYTYMYLEIYGGKIAEWTPEDNAFVHRKVKFDAVMDVYWYLQKDRKVNDDFLQKWINLMETMWDNGVYQNYCSVNVPDYKLNYWKEALPGLVAVKNKYDPNKSFQFAQMVPYEVPGNYPTTDIPPKIKASLALDIDYTGGIPPATGG